jgi:hypothetical protein
MNSCMQRLGTLVGVPGSRSTGHGNTVRAATLSPAAHTARCRRRPAGRERGAILVVTAVTILLLGILGAVLATLYASSTQEHLMAGFTNEALCLVESGARSAVARIVNTFYSSTEPGAPAEVMANFGAYTETNSDGVKTLVLDAPVPYALAGGNRQCAVQVEYTESYDADSAATVGRFRIVSTAQVNPGSGVATRARGAYEFRTSAFEGSGLLFDTAVWAGAGGIDMGSNPACVDSVASASVYRPNAKPGAQVPTNPDGTPNYTAPVVSAKTGDPSINLGPSTIYGNISAAGPVSFHHPGGVSGTLNTAATVASKEPVVDLGNGQDLVTYDSEHALVYSVGADGTLTCTSGSLPGGTWRYDGPLVINVPKGKPLEITGDATLFVAGNFTLASQSGIRIAAGAHLRVVVAGAMDFGTGSEVNPGGSAENALFFGTASCTSVNIVGCPSFVGAVYAPNAAVLISGNTAVLGSVCGNSVTMNGTPRITFDNSLMNVSTGTWSSITYHTEPTQHLRALVVASP